ncbi:hypothetical protein [Noviherbaspirillum sp.]|uniref:hypothetical protein n=1 Tax=Noviherbaspirillum sp. TaxID=1926288 RepID=UPI002DDC981E|nr:hypothetical protein [Noviherbaspirillum sp.]
MRYLQACNIREPNFFGLICIEPLPVLQGALSNYRKEFFSALSYGIHRKTQFYAISLIATTGECNGLENANKPGGVARRINQHTRNGSVKR